MAATLLVGCSTVYRSPGAESLSASQIAILLHPDPLRSGVVFEQVDGAWRGLGSKDRYELTPGVHSLTGAVNKPGLTGAKVTRWFEAEAGHTYEARAMFDRASMKWGFMVFDWATQKRVDVAASPR